MPPHAPRQRWPYIAIALLLSVHLLLVLRANFDFAHSHVFLEMDEKLSYSVNARLLHARSLKNLVQIASLGLDLRYGAVFFNSGALLAWLPAKLWGETGQIVATRMAQAIQLLASYLLLSACITPISLRALFLALVLLLPHTPYYSALPKPEPNQLLFLALYLWYSHRHGFRLGRSWVFLGLAFGAKISSLPLLAPFALASVLEMKENFSGWRNVTRSLCTGTIAFFSGFFVAVPSLLIGLLLRERYYLEDYLNWTFRFTGHGADRTDVGPLDWIRFIAGEWLGTPSQLAALLLTALLVISLILLARLLIHGDRKSRFAAVTFTAGLITNTVIILKVKRVWGMYLHVGTVLMLLSLVSALSLAPLESGLKRIRSLAAVLLVLLCLLRVPPTLEDYDRLAHRTQSPHHTLRRKELEGLVSYFGDSAATNHKKISVYWDPALYLPDDTNQFELLEFWGRVNHGVFVAGRDLIVALKVRFQAPPGGEESIEYTDYKNGITAWDDHVVTCAKTPCYKEIVNPYPDVVVLARTDMTAPLFPGVTPEEN